MRERPRSGDTRSAPCREEGCALARVTYGSHQHAPSGRTANSLCADGSQMSPGPSSQIAQSGDVPRHNKHVMIQFKMLAHPFRNAPKPPASPPPPIWIGWISAAATFAVVLQLAVRLCPDFRWSKLARKIRKAHRRASRMPTGISLGSRAGSDSSSGSPYRGPTR